MTIKEILIAWAEGRYALGWRGRLAMWLLIPVLRDEFCKEHPILARRNKVV